MNTNKTNQLIELRLDRPDSPGWWWCWSQWRGEWQWHCGKAVEWSSGLMVQIDGGWYECSRINIDLMMQSKWFKVTPPNLSEDNKI